MAQMVDSVLLSMKLEVEDRTVMDFEISAEQMSMETNSQTHLRASL